MSHKGLIVGNQAHRQFLFKVNEKIQAPGPDFPKKTSILDRVRAPNRHLAETIGAG